MVVPPLGYYAAPYTAGEPVENVHGAVSKVNQIMDDFDVVMIIPHLSLAWQLVSPKPYDFWIEYDLHLVARCDFLYRGEGASKGADLEVSFAREHGIPVFRSDPELAEWLPTWVAPPRVPDHHYH